MPDVTEQRYLREYNLLVTELNKYRDLFAALQGKLNMRLYGRIVVREEGQGTVVDRLETRVGSDNYPNLQTLKQKVDRALSLQTYLNIAPQD